MKPNLTPFHLLVISIAGWLNKEQRKILGYLLAENADRSLVQRCDVTFWLPPEAMSGWNAMPTGRRGEQQKHSDLAIEAVLTLRLAFHLPLRQAEGFLARLFEMMGIHLEVPDHTTLSRRGRKLEVRLRSLPSSGPIHLVVDSSGLAIFGEGEWAAAKHGGKGIQGWRKLHLGVDASGVIMAQALTDSNVDDATTGVDLLHQTESDIATVIGDAAYDTRPFYLAAVGHGAGVVVPPTKKAAVTWRRCPAREKAIHLVNKIGRRRWKKVTGYHRRARVENTFSRYKSILGDRLSARSRDGQLADARLACNILNRMTELGRPTSVAIKR
jgi:transposase